jgi:hypothetical protein
MYHRAFGLRIKSNLPIPGLLAAAATDAIDIEVYFGASLTPMLSQGLEQSDAEQPLYHFSSIHDGAYFRLTYSDGTDFVFDRAVSKLWASWRAPLTLEDAATYLLGPVFGLILRRRGAACLHASAVAIGGRAIALVGAAGAGKSTTAAALARLGLPVLCDDVLALRQRGEKFFVEPAYPRLRLWPEAVTMLCGAPDALPRLTPSWEKRYLDLSQAPQRFQAQALPLGALYFLAERTDCAAAPRILPLSKRDGLMRAIANTYANLPSDGAPLGREFEVLGRLVNQIRVRQIQPHCDPDKLGDLCQKILDDAAGSARVDARVGPESGHV